MIAFHGQQIIKDKYLSRVSAHRLADELIHGIGWEHGKGCAVGCTLEAYDHARYETELGIPQMLAHLEDVIFEGLPNGTSKEWPERFLSSVPVGADLGAVGWQFLYWLFEDTQRLYATPEVQERCKPVGEILAMMQGKEVYESAESAWSAARSAWSAWSAWSAESAWSAWSAASAASAWSAASAAWSAWSAARSARSAWSAASAASAAWSAKSGAWSAASATSAASAASATSAKSAKSAYKKMADKLIALIEKAPLLSIDTQEETL